MKRTTNNRGVTLIEAVVSITVLAVALPPLVALFTEVAAATPDDTYQRAALTYADALMEEIVSKAFEDPESAPGSFGAEEGARASFDDVDDYDGLSESPPRHVDGSALDAYGGIARSATVENVLASATDAPGAAPDGSTPFKRITVDVAWTGARGGALRLVTLRTDLASALGAAGPLDGPGSSGSALNGKGDELELLLINTTAGEREVEAFALAADRPTSELEEFELASDVGNFHRVWDGRRGVPTGTLPLNDGDPDERAIPALGVAGARFTFRDDLAPGPITFTLTLLYTDGTRSVLTIPMEWQP